MSITLHKDFLGTPFHAEVSGDQIKWVNKIDESNFLFGCPSASNSIEALLHLYGLEVTEFVPKSFRRAFEQCGISDVPWHLALPKNLFMKRLKEVISELISIENVFNESEYPGFFVETNSLFSNLENATIDRPLTMALLKKNDCHALKSILEMSKECRLPLPKYDRVSTKTGRLTIKGGPQILTLNKEFRSIFSSSKAGGRLFEIDFVSLEPRVALNFAGVHASNDVYLSFLQDSNISVSRDTAKLAVLCSLYGAGNRRLDSLLQKEDTNVLGSQLVKAVSKYFKLPSLKRFLSNQARDGMIQNYFGRPIEVDSVRESILVNNYLQSTAADVAIAGFNSFVKKFAKKCKPLFIIHDALIIDVDKEHLDEIQRYVYNGYDMPTLGNFPLKIKEFNHHE